MPFPAVIALGAGVSWLYKTIRMDEAEQDDEAEREARDAAYERTGPIPRELLGQGNWFFVRQAHTFEAHAGFSGTAQVVRWQIVIDTVTHHIKLVHGHVSGKRRVYLDNRRLHEARDVMDTGMEYAFPPTYRDTLGAQLSLWIIEAFTDESDWLYDLEINGTRILKLQQQRHDNSVSDGMQLTEMR